MQRFLPVQQETNCVDCGLLAVAFATNLTHNENPVRRVYDTTKLRQHLVSCLENGKMSVFPSHSSNKKKDFKATVNGIGIYCPCQMPYYNTSEDDVNGSVVIGTMVVVNIAPM